MLLNQKVKIFSVSTTRAKPLPTIAYISNMCVGFEAFGGTRNLRCPSSLTILLRQWRVEIQT